MFSFFKPAKKAQPTEHHTKLEIFRDGFGNWKLEKIYTDEVLEYTERKPFWFSDPDNAKKLQYCAELEDVLRLVAADWEHRKKSEFQKVHSADLA